MYRTTFNAELKQWSGPSMPPLYNPNVSLGQVILDSLRKNRGRIGQISDDTGIHMKNEEILLKSIRVAQNLIKLGYSKNSVCGFYTKNTAFLAPVIFGCYTIGSAVNVINSSYKKEEIIHIFQLTQPTIIFCDFDNGSVMVEAVKDMQLNIPIYSLDGYTSGTKDIQELFNETGTEDNFIPPNIGDGTKQTAVILCSSGTTGLPKGVCISHASILYQFNIFNTTSDDVLFSFSQLYWISGLVVLLTATINGSLRIITAQPYSSELYLKIIEKFHITLTVSSPFLTMDLLRSPQIKSANLNSLKFYLTGGAYISDKAIVELNGYLPNAQVQNIYGVSEMAGVVSLNNPKPRTESVGQLFSGVTVKIIDEHGNQCGIGVQGEIFAKSKYPFIGYSCNRDTINNIRDANDFLQIGDIGYFDEDGYLFVVARTKDIFKYKNYQIAPSEIEAIILQHPHVQDACVVGIPDKLCTNLPAAIIILKNESYVDAEDIANLVKSKLSDAKQLRGGIYIVDSYPVTASGKIIRQHVQDIARKFYEDNKKTKKFY